MIDIYFELSSCSLPCSLPCFICSLPSFHFADLCSPRRHSAVRGLWSRPGAGCSGQEGQRGAQRKNERKKGRADFITFTPIDIFLDWTRKLSCSHDVSPFPFHYYLFQKVAIDCLHLTDKRPCRAGCLCPEEGQPRRRAQGRLGRPVRPQVNSGLRGHFLAGQLRPV